MIFTLSCTGNTRWAAELLSRVTNDRVISIPEAVNGDCIYHLRAGERIGFCLPVHGWRLQPVVREFICKLKFVTQNAAGLHKGSPSPYCYFLITCGDSCGEYGDRLEEVLAAKGLEVRSCCSVIMPESYVGLPFMDVDTDLREAEKKMKARGTVLEFADIVAENRSVRMPVCRGALPRFYSRVLGKFFYKFLITDKRFRVNADKCIGCGMCKKHCPTGNVAMNGGKPEWLHTGSCMTCMACYHYCPEKAISFWKFTKNKGQYYFDHNKTKRKNSR
ncbi:MAG: ferredoxin family protein [Bacteroidales bacterium]|nr:ferredoxin family protein [Bacteroidales bacterium]MCM1147796.1 ferredoxin family protein [Bacteroidales bacterium]MCM1206444.1 ferredoxin family protein [Bacillota bacterium]MCM1510329.1 ferredoxin family protein [Clostridium sp.]